MFRRFVEAQVLGLGEVEKSWLDETQRKYERNVGCTIARDKNCKVKKHDMDDKLWQRGGENSKTCFSLFALFAGPRPPGSQASTDQCIVFSPSSPSPSESSTSLPSIYVFPTTHTIDDVCASSTNVAYSSQTLVLLDLLPDLVLWTFQYWSVILY